MSDSRPYAGVHPAKVAKKLVPSQEAWLPALKLEEMGPTRVATMVVSRAPRKTTVHVLTRMIAFFRVEKSRGFAASEALSLLVSSGALSSAEAEGDMTQLVLNENKQRQSRDEALERKEKNVVEQEQKMRRSTTYRFARDRQAQPLRAFFVASARLVPLSGCLYQSRI